MSKFQNDIKQFLYKIFQERTICDFLGKTNGGNFLQIPNFIITGNHKKKCMRLLTYVKFKFLKKVKAEIKPFDLLFSLKENN